MEDQKSEKTEATVGVRRFDRSPTTTKIVEMFLNTQPGDVLTESEIDAATTCTRDAWGGCMPTVKAVLLRDHQIRIESERGLGYRHLTDDEIASSQSSRDVAKVHKAARRGRLRTSLGIKDPSKLPVAKIAQFALAEHTTSAKATKVLESTKAANGSYDIASTLDVLKKRLPG